MDHQRQKIRRAVTQALVSAGTSAGARVYPTRMAPWRTTHLPAISIYTDDETVSDDSRNTAPRELERTVQLAIEIGIGINTNGNIDDEMDDIALQVERVMHADPQFGGTCSTSLLASTETHVKLDGDRPMGMVRMVYATLYYTAAPDPADVPLVDLIITDVHYDLSNAQATADQAEDIID